MKGWTEVFWEGEGNGTFCAEEASVRDTETVVKCVQGWREGGRSEMLAVTLTCWDFIWWEMEMNGNKFYVFWIFSSTIPPCAVDTSRNQRM